MLSQYACTEVHLALLFGAVIADTAERQLS